MESGQKQRQHYSPELKLRAVMESYQRDTTIEAVRRKYNIRGSLLHRWREEFQKNAVQIFSDKRSPQARRENSGHPPGEAPEELKKIIGNLTVQNEILKKTQSLLACIGR